jgi:hypothetical protein
MKGYWTEKTKEKSCSETGGAREGFFGKKRAKTGRFFGL